MCCSDMGCAAGLVKFLVFGGNAIFALGGLALVIVGVLYKLNINDFTDAIPEDYSSIGLAPVLTIVVGAVIFFIAFFGCCGALRESTCLLTTYAIILLILFLLQIAVGVFAFLEVKDEEDFRGKVNNELQNLFNAAKESPNANNKKMELVNVIQKELECCGPDSSIFWGNAVPDSCKNSNGDIFRNGCKSEFFSFLKKSMNVIGIVLLALSALEVIGCVLSLCLSSSIKNRERRFKY